MKKIASLLLALAMLLPVLAMAETAVAPAMHTFDFGVFMIDLAETDVYQVAEEMTDNAVYLQVYPDYDPSKTMHPNFNFVWTAQDPTMAIKLYGAENYAKLGQEAAKQQYEQMGIAVNDAQVLSATFEDDIGAFFTVSTLDYTGMGIELVTPVYQLQVFMCMGDAGTYIFTFSADTLEKVEEISAYLDTVVFPEAEE